MADRPPAPARLAIVQAFLNTIDLEDHIDQLATPKQLDEWLCRYELCVSGELTPDDVAWTISVREALRDLLEAHHSTPPRPPATGVLERAAEAGKLVTRFSSDGTASLEAASSGLDGALGEILGIVYTAMADGTWYRLKVCQWDVCRWAFYDHSKNRSSSWCSMAVCGNRAKAATYRKRHAIHQ
jgi:predicted RNA-binding Zn ribbon-like protein